MAVLFDDGFEDGTKDAFGAQTGTVTVSTGSALAGTVNGIEMSATGAHWLQGGSFLTAHSGDYFSVRWHQNHDNVSWGS